MISILIIDNQYFRRELLSRELEENGYFVIAIDEAHLDLTQLNCSEFDVILNMHSISVFIESMIDAHELPNIFPLLAC